MKRLRAVAVYFAFAFALAVGLAAPAGAATLETLDVPSRFVDPATANFNEGGAMKATVMLPDGYDPKRAYPLVFLLHGVGDNYAGWASPAKGDILKSAAGVQAIIVMPEGAKGFYTDWWNDGARGAPMWESYELERVLPLVQKRYRIRPERRYHVMMGVSMGGLGAAYLGGRLPGYFGTVVIYSGFVDHQRAEVVNGGMAAVAGIDYQTVWGPGDGYYATAHNPSKTAINLKTQRVLVTTGDGNVDPALDEDDPVQANIAGLAERVVIRPMVDRFVRALREADVAFDFVPRAGTHAWPYWRKDWRTAIEWGLFKPVDEHPSRWTNLTVAQHGDLFGVKFVFDSGPPPGIVRFVASASRLRGVSDGGDEAANGTRVTLTTRRGCRVRKTIPFDVKLPTRRCKGGRG